MLAHRRVHADPREIFNLPDGFRIQEPAHAVQSLKLELGAAGSQFQNRCNAVRIVSRELRTDHVGMAEQRTRTREIGHVGRVLRVYTG